MSNLLIGQSDALNLLLWRVLQAFPQSNIPICRCPTKRRIPLFKALFHDSLMQGNFEKGAGLGLAFSNTHPPPPNRLDSTWHLLTFLYGATSNKKNALPPKPEIFLPDTNYSISAAVRNRKTSDRKETTSKVGSFTLEAVFHISKVRQSISHRSEKSVPLARTRVPLLLLFAFTAFAKRIKTLNIKFI